MLGTFGTLPRIIGSGREYVPTAATFTLFSPGRIAMPLLVQRDGGADHVLHHEIGDSTHQTDCSLGQVDD